MLRPDGATIRAALAAIAAALAAACALRGAPAAKPASRPSHAITFADVQPIIRENCEHCHDEDKDKGGLMMTSYEAVMAGGDHGNILIPRDSASSRMIQMLEGRITPRMPYKEHPLAASELSLLRAWIDQGALPAAAGATAAAPVVDAPPIAPKVPVTGAIAAVAFDPSGARLAVGSYKSVHVLSLARRTWQATLSGHADLVRAIAFSPDGRRLAVAGGPSGRFGEIKIWELDPTPKVIATIQGHTDTILTVAFSPDGSTLASGSYDKLVKLWDVREGKLKATLKEHSDAVYALAFMPDGKHLVSGAGDRTVKVWDVTTAKRIFTMNDALDTVYAVAVDPNGDHVAAAGADRMIRTWAWKGDEATLVASTFAHGDAVLRLVYSASGASLVSGGADRMIKTWDAKTLRETQTFEMQPDWVMGLALSRDDRWIAAGRFDGTLGLYPLNGDASGEQFVVPKL